MTPPDEAFHFRGKTLTPESPRPLHIPEPANIPVLENQMDPVFNDTSTYERSVYNQVQTHDGWHENLNGRGPRQNQNAGSFHGQDRAMQNDMTIAAKCYPPTSEAEGSGNAGYSPPDPSYAHAAPVAPTSQGFASDEVDSTNQLPNRLDAEKEDERPNAGVNFQNLLDNLSQPNSGAAASGTGAMPLAENPSFHQAPTDEPLLTQGLPAQTTHYPPNPHYAPNDEGNYNLFAHEANAAPAYTAHPSNPPPKQSQPFSIAPGTASSVHNLPPPPTASFQTQSAASESQGSSQDPAQAPKKGRVDKQGRPIKGIDDDSPWGPEVQKKYDEFLHDERIYVTEGLWDRFPMGSRLFVGNLPTERVTKRDMFHIFHKYGKLAQISIKQAYGFIQFLEAPSCHAALGVEQGAIISKSPSLKDLLDLLQHQSLPGHPRRVAHGRQSSAVLPHDLPLEFLAIDTTGPMSQVDCLSAISGMSPLTAGAMIVVRHDHHPLDPSGPEMDIGRAIEPQKGLSDEGVLDLHVLPGLPILETGAIALLVLEELDRNFVLHVENAFRNRGLRVDVLVLGPRIPLGAAVHRQFIEGVLAVVRLSRPNQISRKIPLQLFDRTAGLDNVRFLDYPELEPNMSAELLSHQAQAMQRGAAPAAFAPNPAFGIPTVPPMPIPQPGLPALSNPPNIANLIGSLDGPSLSSLLSALQRPPHSQPVSATQSPFASPNPPPPADLASLLTNANRPPPISTTPQQPLPPFNLQPPNPPVVTDPNLLSLLAKGLGGQQPQGQGPSSPQVQNLMHHLAKWKQ
ncbi:hypothetical protein N7508_008888 [Penicillium antarcticum]|uniref:uncharacterized protein n=1 Tax=Penicillium antarcticum TaxID=416450 RepID=UPI00239EE286|nr:uncharacterized protein N7508_008888 [Penicillium antarcticum]KAJ5294067.1 hypothetical protein N7508_008888 [Penicillium antarcticum]